MTIEIEPGRYFSHFWFVSCPTKDRRALRGARQGARPGYSGGALNYFISKPVKQENR